MAGKHEVLADLLVKGKITSTSVPNKTGVPLIWNLDSGDISHRTVAEFIADYGLLTEETDPTVPAYTKTLNSANKLLTEIKTVDGVGSGLDSDLLDGQHGAYYDHRIHGLGTNTTNGSPARVDINGDPITSLNDFYLSGFHQIDQGMNYTDGPYPSGGASRGAILNFISHHSSLSQIFLSREDNEMWFRDGYGGWKPWVRIMTTGNIDEIVEGQGYVKEVTWAQVTGKPTEFNPSSHTHPWSQITDTPIFDNYQSWNLKTNGVQRTTVQSGGDLNLIQGSNITLSYSAGGGVTINSSYVDTTYSNMSLTELTTGTLTTARTVSAKTLNDWVTSKGFLTGVSWAQITGKPTIPTKTSDLTNDSGFITGQEPAKVRVIFINPEELPTNHTKADVVAYLTANPVTKGKGETIIVRVGTVIAAPQEHWSIPVVDAYEQRVLADYGVMEDREALIEFLKQ